VPVGLVIQHAQRLRRVVLASVGRSVLQYFETLSHKPNDFRGEEKKLLNLKCVLIFSRNLSKKFLILGRI